ncbi:hypothetical protein ACFFQW_26740 [Umezawaea endophytica]|uniref:NPCBM/NEW2 domain-containing protein n=1 Tax=Umezawaea endophytica TaxID=1654476 RepID=A0A9X3A689_9PSEU|nr:hypothetical protein [Umezawaea endophytica]MCS7483133.1 hypothetical protein [Umezawaea endophytica]
MDHESRPDPLVAQQSADASNSSKVVQAGRDVVVHHHHTAAVTRLDGPSTGTSNAAKSPVVQAGAIEGGVHVHTTSGLVWGAVIVGIVAVTALGVAVGIPFGSSPTGSAPSSPWTQPSPTTTTTSSSVPSSTAPSAEVASPGPLARLTPLDGRVLSDETVTVENKPGFEAKIAHLSCVNGVPGVLVETYDLGGFSGRLTTKVAVRDTPTGAPVTFAVIADGVTVASITLPVKSAEELEAKLAGVRRVTLRTSAAACVDVSGAWVEPALETP